MYKFFAALLFVTYAFVNAPMAQEAAPPLNTAGLDTARLALDRGDTQTAAKVLAQINPATVDLNDFDFLRATLAIMQGDYPTGIAGFRTILGRDPTLIRARLDLAQAYFLAGDDAAAEFHFRAALAQGVPDAVRGNVERYLERISERRRMTFAVGLALAPDSNINTATNADSIDVFGLPFLLDPSSQSRSGLGLAATLGANGRWPLTNTIALRSGAFAAGSFYGASRFNDVKLDGEAGPAIRTSVNTEVAILATASRRWFGDRHLLTAPGLKVEAAYIPTPRWRLTANLAWENRSYVSGFAAYSGPAYSAVGSAAYSLDASSSVQGYGGAVREQARDGSLRAWQYIGGGSYARDNIMGGFALQAGLQVARIVYDQPSFFFSKARRETQLEARLSLGHAAIEVWGFSPVVSVIRTDRFANVALYSYHRTRAEIGVRRFF